MTGKLSKNFHGVGIGPLSKILAVNRNLIVVVKMVIWGRDWSKSQEKLHL